MEPEGSLPVFTKAYHWPLPWTRWIQSTTFHPISLRSIIILFSYLHLRLPSGPFISGFPTKILYAFFISQMRAKCSVHLTLVAKTISMVIKRHFSSL